MAIEEEEEEGVAFSGQTFLGRGGEGGGLDRGNRKV
jgi:hypothetical protein